MTEKTATAAIENACRPHAFHQLVDHDKAPPLQPIRQQELINSLYDVVSDMILILDEYRRIVYANSTFLRIVARECREEVVGMRPGEAFNCAIANQADKGCGTTEFCENCGAANAIFDCEQGRPGQRECRIRLINGDALDLRVATKPLDLENRRLTLCAITDASDEKRRHVLERIFFHDIANMATGIRLAALRLNRQSEDPTMHRIEQAACTLVESIRSQRLLLAAERNELSVQPSRFNTVELLSTVANAYDGHDLCQHREITMDPQSAALDLHTDKALLARVLDNMVKNALEASEPGQSVTLGCRQHGSKVEFWVHNHGYMPRDVQLQVFQRSFSTKGRDRGLGTHSIKLLSERYLKGSVMFRSSQTDGTTFSVLYPKTLGFDGRIG